jgi:hypothetical protein
MNIEFYVEVCASLHYWKHESKLQRNPMFCRKKIPKQHLKFVLYQNKVCGFLLQVLQAPPTFLQKNLLVSSSFPPPCYLELSPL